MSTGRPWRSEGLLAFHPVLNHRVKRRWSWAEAEGCGGSSGITQGLGGVGCTLRPRYYSYSTPVPPPPSSLSDRGCQILVFGWLGSADYL